MKKIVVCGLSVLFISSFCFADNAKGYKQINLNEKSQQKMVTELSNVLEQQKQESAAPYTRMQKNVEAFFRGFTGVNVKCSKIVDLKCDIVKMYYIDVPEHSYIEFLPDSKTKRTFFRLDSLDNPIVYAKCFIKGKENSFDVVRAPIYTAIHNEDIEDYAADFDKNYSSTIYKFEPDAYLIKAEEYPDSVSIPVEDPSWLHRQIYVTYRISDMKSIGKISSLKKNYLKTFNIEDYK